MNTLEQEIIQKFHQLQPAAQRRVWAFLEQEMTLVEPHNFDYETWFADMEHLRQAIHPAGTPPMAPLHVVGILRDLRDGTDE
jgi:hypothetical protein